MRKIVPATLLALLLFLGAEPALPQTGGGQGIICNQQVEGSGGAQSLIQVVAGQAGKSISVCGFVLSSGAAASTFSLVTGTGTNCNTAQDPVLPVVNLGINQSLVLHAGVAVYSGAGGAAMCYVITGTGPLTWVVYYIQL